ncbi:MAG: hypothetical protein ACI9UR_001620 [Bacteroidia bacterium]|jgi:hypothetical protein
MSKITKEEKSELSKSLLRFQKAVLESYSEYLKKELCNS